MYIPLNLLTLIIVKENLSTPLKGGMDAVFPDITLQHRSKTIRTIINIVIILINSRV